MNCYCTDREHEICYDNIIGMYDDRCECCRVTFSILQKINREVRDE